MPNWCNNQITITGPVTMITALWDRAVAADGLLSAMAPADDPNDYSWKKETWGTKWEVLLEGLEIEAADDGTATISGYFDSAWKPPVAAYEGYCAANPQVKIEAYYLETGNKFVGCWEDGEDDYHEYGEFTSENIRVMVPPYLVDYFDLVGQVDETETEWAI